MQRTAKYSATRTAITVKNVGMVAEWHAIEAKSVKHRGEKRKFHFGMSLRHDLREARGCVFARKAVRHRPIL